MRSQPGPLCMLHHSLLGKEEHLDFAWLSYNGHLVLVPLTMDRGSGIAPSNHMGDRDMFRTEEARLRLSIRSLHHDSRWGLKAWSVPSILLTNRPPLAMYGLSLTQPWGTCVSTTTLSHEGSWPSSWLIICPPGIGQASPGHTAVSPALCQHLQLWATTHTTGSWRKGEGLALWASLAAGRQGARALQGLQTSPCTIGKLVTHAVRLNSPCFKSWAWKKSNLMWE